MTEKGLKFSALHLCTILFGVFVLQAFTGFDPGFNASKSSWWKFFASFLGHSDVEHLFNNLFFIGLFGTLYELLTSRKIFWSTFLVSAVGANLTAFIFYPDSFIIGASGGAMGLLSALAFYRPRKTGLALGVPAPMYMVLASYLLINFAGLTGSSSVAYEAHLFGLLTGGIIGLWLRTRENADSEAEKEFEEVSDWERKIREWERKYMFD
ncbi:MAG: rhomboid family intramembrane serine protease [Candidatus Nanosalina sp.]